MGKKKPFAAEKARTGRSPRASQASAVDTSKQPRRAFEPGDTDGRLVVRFNRVDTAGEWCLSNIMPTEHLQLLNRLRSIETMTVREVFNQGQEPGKHYEIEKCPNPAMVRRLEQLQFDDETRISRLRFGGKGRLFGFLRNTHFYALWWDLEHAIWPSKLRNA